MGVRFYAGDQLRFQTRRGNTMPARSVGGRAVNGLVEVIVSNDPFTSWVEASRLRVVRQPTERSTQMPTALTAKAMRTKARELGIEGWEDMDKDELSTALVEAEGSVPAKPKKAAPAKKAAAAKKAPAKAAAKAAAKKAPVAESDPDDPNPFRPGSNLHLMVKELMRGGKRSAMVTRLRGKIDLKPRARSGSDFDLDEEIDYRLVRVCQVLTNDHGFTIEKDGRGKDQFVKAVPSES